MAGEILSSLIKDDHTKPGHCPILRPWRGERRRRFAFLLMFSGRIGWIMPQAICPIAARSTPIPARLATRQTSIWRGYTLNMSC